MLSSLTALEDKLYALQAQIQDLQNQNCEYELKFSRMGLAAECRILETKMSFETGEPLPWKLFARENMFNPANKNEEKISSGNGIPLAFSKLGECPVSLSFVFVFRSQVESYHV